MRLAPRLADGLAMIRTGVLGLDLRAEGEFIRMRDPATREDILHQRELKALAERETARAQREAARREVAEARAKREAERADGKPSARSGKPRNAWSRRLASRSWRPPFNLLKGALLSLLRGALLSLLKSALSGVCAAAQRPDDRVAAT